MLYFAYGSNLNIAQMARRCPRATPIRAFALKDWQLVFRGVADIVQKSGAVVWGGVWDITDECERALDRYEGLSSGLYRKVHGKLAQPIAGQTEMMFYVMNSEGIFPPSEDYLDAIREGYRDFDLKPKTLRDAVRRSHDKKAPSHHERQRYARTGRPRLATRPA